MFLKPSKAMQQLADALPNDGTASVEGRSLWQDARRRFMLNKAAVVSLFVIILITLFSIFGGYFAQFTYEEIDWMIIADPTELGKPSLSNGHYFGTDQLGRDLYARTVQGGQISLMVGVLSSVVAIVIGTLYGAVSGFIGGRVDILMMRVVEVISALPFMFLVIVLMLVFGRHIILIFVAIGAVSWLDMARIVRGQTLSLKNKEFIEAAYACGVSQWRIVLRHIVPNVLGIVLVYASLMIPSMIMFESFISFLGLGVQEPETSWGALISEGVITMEIAIWQLAIPLSFLIVTLFCFNFVGDGLRDALDPKER
jgi:oligopeptide transport system permease protein